VVLLEHDCSPSRWQAPGHCRARICLLKGCEERFSPQHPRARYCSEPCRDAARDWSVWQAGRRYRPSERGKECRRQQAYRYRERVRQRREESGRKIWEDMGSTLISVAFFASGSTAGQCAPESGHHEFDSLFGKWTNGFTLLYMDGSKQKFNASGMLHAMTAVPNADRTPSQRPRGRPSESCKKC
jgi:hypothetical protein